MTVRGTHARRGLVVLLAACAAVLATPLVTDASPTGPVKVSSEKARPKATASSYTGLQAQGSLIVDGSGRPVRLLGFNSSGAEYACIEGWGIFDGPKATTFNASVVKAMQQWTGATAVRIPLNEQCWLGLGVKSRYGALTYRRAVHALVDQLNARGLIAVLDLHRSAPGKAASRAQEQMPDRDHSVEFWRQVATEYRDYPSVVFDLFNEPWPYGDVTSTQAWTCWRDGGCLLPSQNGEGQYVAAGMSELLGAVRGVGAHNLVVLSGIHWAEQLDRWLEFAPADPAHNIAAGFHNYPYNRFCVTQACYDTVLAQVAATVPLVAGEIGADNVGPDCNALPTPVTGFSSQIFDWLDAHHASYLAWSWNAWKDPCSLVTDYNSGSPTNGWGTQVKARLAANAVSAARR
jgi:endoglucanase